MNEQFQIDVEAGLSNTPKTLPSKYFYNEEGDALFVKIMHSPEYYLTRAELEIFQTQNQQIIDSFDMDKDSYFELIELGAGDGLKTKELLKKLDSENYNFSYLPIDISQNALKQLEACLKDELPNVSVQPKQGEYFKILASLKENSHPKVVLFLGSNIGNLSDDMASKFIYQLGGNLKTHDKLMLGVDLIKPSSIVLPAYNDQQGYTRDFNLNLLRRINNELDANFDITCFAHRPEYDEEEGITKSFLVSTKNQTVRINAINKSFDFAEDEKIQTEMSRKYNDDIVHKLIEKTDFTIVAKFTDSKNYFADYILDRG